MTASLLFGALLNYLLGGIPIGLYVGRAKGIPDIRKYGSGNIGATNVLRVLGVRAALVVWFADCLKGLVPVLLARHVFGLELWPLAIASGAAIAGHCFSPFLGFTGGRGASTGFGVMLGLYWPVGLGTFLVFVAVVARSRYVSLGSMLAAVSAPVWMLVFLLPSPDLAGHTAPYFVAGVSTAAMIIHQHAPNIQRLRAGTERKIGQRELAPTDEGAQEASDGE